MPDTEMLKMVVNGGSFGLLAIIVVWMLFKAAPMLRDMISKLGEDHKEAVATIMATQETQIAEHKEAIASIVKENKETASVFVAAMGSAQKECREERRELAARLDHKP